MKVTYQQGSTPLSFKARRFMSPLVLAGFYPHVYRSMRLPAHGVDFDSLKPAQRTLARKLAQAMARGYVLNEFYSSQQGEWSLDQTSGFDVDLSTWDEEYLVTITFENASDAMRFKLTWVGVEA